MPLGPLWLTLLLTNEKPRPKQLTRKNKSTNFIESSASVTPNWNGSKKRSMGSDCSLHPAAICPRDLSPLIESNHPSLTVSRQAELLGLSRRSCYYEPAFSTDARVLLKRDMDAIDAICTDYPFYGSGRMQLGLFDRYGIDIGRLRIRKVMQLQLHP